MEIIKINELSVLENSLINQAIQIREFSYSPYSNFKVGASVLAKNGKIYTGCNVESCDYTLTTHAEMDAINSMVKDGCVKFDKICIVLKSEQGLPSPCGLCRQKMIEFANSDPIIFGYNLANENEIYLWKLSELIPFQFTKNNL